MRPRIINDTDLLDLLLAAFADLGYEGTSIRELCRHLGVSHNLIHQRYQSKENAWYAAVDHGFNKLSEDLLQPEEYPSDPLEALRLAMWRYAEATLARPALARVIHQEAARPGPRWDYMVERFIGPTRAGVAELIGQLQASGRVREGAAETVQFFLTTWGIGGLASVPVERVGANGAHGDKVAVARLAVDVVIDGLSV